MELNNKIEVYPNPATDKIIVNSAENSLLEISNLQDQLILNKKINKAQSIDISEFEKGIYFVKVSSEKEVRTGKFIVE